MLVARRRPAYVVLAARPVKTYPRWRTPGNVTASASGSGEFPTSSSCNSVMSSASSSISCQSLAASFCVHTHCRTDTSHNILFSLHESWHVSDTRIVTLYVNASKPRGVTVTECIAYISWPEWVLLLPLSWAEQKQKNWTTHRPVADSKGGAGAAPIGSDFFFKKPPFSVVCICDKWRRDW